jgi:hypothetical protein
VPSGLIDEGEEFHVLIEDTEKGILRLRATSWKTGQHLNPSGLKLI